MNTRAMYPFIAISILICCSIAQYAIVNHYEKAAYEQGYYDGWTTGWYDHRDFELGHAIIREQWENYRIGDNQSIVGDVDHVYIFNRTLNESEIIAMCRGGIKP